MSTTFRHYLFPDDGPPQRLSQRVTQALVFDHDSMPQFAGTRQRVLTIYIDNDDGKPQKITSYEAAIWTFDHAGSISAGLQESLREVMDAMSAEHHQGREHGQTVIPIGREIARRRLAARHRWEPTSDHLDAVAADIWPKGKAERLKVASGATPRKPKVTYEAKQALVEASNPFSKIKYGIDRLSEPGLAGFIWAARNESEDPDFAPLFGALVQIAERRLEILKRRRRNKGTWYAFVELLRWESDRFSCETAATYHVRCESRAAAVVAARTLLARHADKFAADYTIEAGIETDLEWENAARISVNQEP